MAAVGLGAAHKDSCRNNNTVDDFTAPVLPAAQLFLCRNVCVVAQCSYLFGTHFFGVIADYRDVPPERLRYAYGVASVIISRRKIVVRIYISVHESPVYVCSFMMPHVII